MYFFERDRYAAHIRELFAEEHVLDVLNWFESTMRRRPVVLVGAGFSRNAVPVEGAIASELPDWSGLTSLFTTYLTVPEESSTEVATTGFGTKTVGLHTADVPHLAELFHEQARPSEFIDRLQLAVPDSDFEPGEAHLALYDYDAEAIITTNNLDTLLDRDGQRRWFPVKKDIDLMQARFHGSRRQREVIYLHGHRSDPDSWVLTRSQYEDVPASKPCIWRKVQQLAIQHPLLVVGYSLFDSDFHALFRSVHRDLHGTNMRSIALIKDPVHQAERAHWKRLGMTLVPFKSDSPLTVGQQLTFFFSKLQPLKHQPSRELVRDVLSTIARQSGFEAKLALYAEFEERLEGETTLGRGRTLRRWRPWSEVARTTVGGARWSRLISGGGLEHLAEVSLPPQLAGDGETQHDWVLDAVWGKTEPVAIANDLLSNARVAPRLVADWLRRGLRVCDLETEDPRIFHPPNVCRALGATISYANQLSEPIPNALVARYVRSCVRTAYKYFETSLLEELQELAPGGPVTDHDQRKNDGDAEPHFWARMMETGFRAAMNGKRDDAVLAYWKAARDASSRANLEEEWKAVRSAYLTPGLHHPILGEEDPVRLVREAVAARWNVLERNHVVAETLSAEADRIAKAGSENVESLVQRARQEWRGTSQRTLSNTFHHLWRSLREYELDFCAPALQELLARPLVDGSRFPPEVELEYRLRLRFKRTNEFLEWVADDLEIEPGRRDAIRRSVVSQLATPGASVAENVSRLESLPAVVPFLHADELEGALSFLRCVWDDVGLHYYSFSADGLLFGGYSRSLRALLRFASPEVAFFYLRAFWKRTRETEEAEYFGRTLGDLPLSEWARREPRLLTQLLNLVASVGENLVGRRNPHSGGIPSVFISLVSLVRSRGRQSLSLRQRRRLLSISRPEKLDYGPHDWASKLWGLLLRYELLDESDSNSLRDSADDWLRSAIGEMVSERDSLKRCVKMESLSGVVAGLLERASRFPPDISLVRELFGLMSTNREELWKYLSNNTQYSSSFARLFVLSLRLLHGDDAATCRRMIIELMDLIPTLMPDVLLVWPEDVDALDACWDRRLEQLFSGALTESQVSGAARALDSLHILVQRGLLPEEPHRSSLVGQARLFLHSRNVFLATRSLAVLLELAVSTEDEGEAQILVDAIAPFVGDPRTRVRAWAAFAAGRLSQSARTDLARREGQRLCSGLEDDRCLMVQSQLASGAASLAGGEDL